MYLVVELLVMPRFFYLRGTPIPSHIPTIQQIPSFILSFGFLQEALRDAPPVCSQSIHYTPLSIQFCLYVVTTEFFFLPLYTTWFRVYIQTLTSISTVPDMS